MIDAVEIAEAQHAQAEGDAQARQATLERLAREYVERWVCGGDPSRTQVAEDLGAYPMAMSRIADAMMLAAQWRAAGSKPTDVRAEMAAEILNAVSDMLADAKALEWEKLGEID